MQTSPFTPIPPPLRSGRVELTTRSDSDTRIRLVIGDESREFRESLRASFACDPRIQVVAETDDGEATLHVLRRLRPDVALLDADMPSFGGAAIARILRSEIPETRVVVLTRSRSEVHR